uniref:Arrestin-like N-terminal domain-containing protein n=1 Tax=Palpitomonas bilix TaxID=652834 RepID=A0A7S3CYD6_9EUKA|mmetsp:Transcript_1470/g.2877  ORF Transcript_1470/g.2877 Transcript_1470/m.2877 type:complete len:311 (+) Transcript_1470:123-1055(+)
MALSIELRLHNINNLNGYFEVYTGTTISGEVVVRNPTPLKARGVRIKIVGHEYVHWTEQRTEGDGENRRTYTEHISDGVTFFEERQTVWQRSSSSERLQPGEYAWPFQMILPANLPPSFEMFGSVDAFVRYRFSAYIDLPWRFDKALEIFLIVRQYVPEQFIASSFSSNLQLQNRKTIGVREECMIWPSDMFTFFSLPASACAAKLGTCKHPYSSPLEQFARASRLQLVQLWTTLVREKLTTLPSALRGEFTAVRAGAVRDVNTAVLSRYPIKIFAHLLERREMTGCFAWSFLNMCGSHFNLLLFMLTTI